MDFRTSKWLLVDDLLSFSYKRAQPGEKFKLASGGESDFFIDVKQTILRANSLRNMAKAMYMKASAADFEFDAVAGVPLGGVAIATAVSMVLSDHYQNTPQVFIRKEAKDHGTGKLIESVPDVKSVLLVEDVVTSGGSSIKVIKTLRDNGFAVSHVLAVVDREEGAAENLQAAGVTLLSVVRVSELHAKFDKNRRESETDVVFASGQS